MNTNLNTTTIFQGLTAAAVALVLTWVLSWNFVDSTRVARWVSAADAAAHAATPSIWRSASDRPGAGASSMTFW